MLTSIPKRVFFSLCDGYFGFGERSRDYLMSLGAKREKIFIPCQAAALPGSFSPETRLAERRALRARAIRRCSCTSAGFRKRRASAR